MECRKCWESWCKKNLSMYVQYVCVHMMWNILLNTFNKHFVNACIITTSNQQSVHWDCLCFCGLMSRLCPAFAEISSAGIANGSLQDNTSIEDGWNDSMPYVNYMFASFANCVLQYALNFIFRSWRDHLNCTELALRAKSPHNNDWSFRLTPSIFAKYDPLIFLEHIVPIGIACPRWIFKHIIYACELEMKLN